MNGPASGAGTAPASRPRLKRLPMLGDRWLPSRNAFGFLRLALTFGVVISHSWPIGFGWDSPGDRLTFHQTELGRLSLFGLLVVAGFLNTESALRLTARAFLWRRFLRIFPAFWVCLVVTALVIAPLVALRENGALAGFWDHSDGPFSYLGTNWFLSMSQLTISGLLSHTPFGILSSGPSDFDGSLWSLKYEFCCYLVLAVLIATGLLRRARRTILVLTAVAFLLILRNVLQASQWRMAPPIQGTVGPLPLVGTFDRVWILYLGFLFLLGCSARMYMHRLPMHWAGALLAAAILAFTLWRGGFLVFGLPAFAYLVLYAVVALPGWFTRVGRVRDYSYGVYIYAFPVQQMVALLGGNRHGIVVYIAICVVFTLALAIPSWHFIERPALRLKHRRLTLSRRGGHDHSRPASGSTPLPLQGMPDRILEGQPGRPPE